MSSGGARARSGPPPDPNALRRDRKDDAEWRILPATGREGEPPVWPFDSQSAREGVLWARLWALPQAVVWEEQRQELEVALYVRRFVEAEKPGSAANLSNLVKQLGEGLGLSLPGMARHRWKIEGLDPVAPKAAAASGASVRNRFTVVDGGRT